MKKWFVLILTIIMATIVVGAATIYYQGNHPMSKAKSEAIDIAKSETDLKEVDNFYWYNGKETYFTVTGKTNKNKAIIVIIAKKGGKTTVIDADKAISEGQARSMTREAKNPEKILESRIGMDKKVPIWEVAYQEKNGRLGYHVITLEDGEYIRDIGNI
ncbi:hypothetical protein BFC22_07725 [Carnobacterium divergens]|uniref:cell wall elongation regulator TseB-like domain-containing protein n=1 Tax=Carnobacterium divergens TaxID=2748 RepID=UPI000E755D03|nr:DUF5590 domain-containing protein [Carnobacterium divergens]ANZ99995.1 hypothetical protein BFC22_07725 [Carnobacterium divergens]MDT2010891.1 DUF5590 domain-containing protein [Carnobacterium divergens]